MPQTQTHAEPSMEEILASIRRIISEEENVGAATGADADETSAAAEDLVVFEAKPTPPRPAAQPESARAAAPPPAAQLNGSAPANGSASGVAAQVSGLEPRIVSPPAASAASEALTRLVGAVRIADQPGQTLEGVVRELLKPMLKEWLDKNLPAIVEAKVEAELERIARLAR
jgi:cell pole-organizing protein PopZ